MAEDQKIPFEYQIGFGEANEQEKIAEMLYRMQMQNQKALQGQVVSNHYVKPSWTQYMADLFMSHQGGKAERKANEIRQGTRARLATDEMDQLRRVLGTAMGQPEVPWGTGMTGTMDEQDLNPGKPAVPPDLRRATAMAAGSKFPNVQKLSDDLSKLWTTQMNTAAQGATDPSRVAAGQSGNLSDLRPKAPFGPVQNVAPPGMRPTMGQTDPNTGKVSWGPGEPVTVNTGDRWDRALVAKKHDILWDDKVRGPAKNSRDAFENAGMLMRLAEADVMNKGITAEVATIAQSIAGAVGKEIDPRASGTQIYSGIVLPYLGQLVQMFGAGTGISNEDRKQAAKGLADATKNPQAMKPLLMFMAKKSWRGMQEYNASVAVGRMTAMEAQMNPGIFDDAELKFKAIYPPSMGDNPDEWPDATQEFLNDPRNKVTVPTVPGSPIRSTWGRNR